MKKKEKNQQTRIKKNPLSELISLLKATIFKLKTTIQAKNAEMMATKVILEDGKKLPLSTLIIALTIAEDATNVKTNTVINLNWLFISPIDSMYQVGFYTNWIHLSTS